MNKSYLSDATRVPTERKSKLDLRVYPSVDEPDFELEPGRWALCSPGNVLGSEDYARVQKVVRKMKRGENAVYDEELGALIFKKVSGPEMCVETILDNQPWKVMDVIDGIVAIIDNSVIGSGRNANVLRFTLNKSANGFVKRSGKVTGIQLWRDTGDGRACVDVVAC